MNVVYLAINRQNGKRYVGVTSYGLEHRRYKHEWHALHGKTVECRAFLAALRKYGIESFDWSVIAECLSFDEALREEVGLIAKLKPEYNLTTGGEGARGHKRSQETTEKWRKSRGPVILSQESVAKIVAKNTGQKRTSEQRERMGAARRGKPFSEEHKRNLSPSRAGRQLTEEHRKNIGLGLRRHFDAEARP